jgi:hypothetical protein
MKLEAWVKERTATTGTSKRAVLEDLAERAGVAYITLEPIARGARMGNYGKALSVSEATGWKVSVLDLCDPDPERTAAHIIAQYQPQVQP